MSPLDQLGFLFDDALSPMAAPDDVVPNATPVVGDRPDGRGRNRHTDLEATGTSASLGQLDLFAAEPRPGASERIDVPATDGFDKQALPLAGIAHKLAKDCPADDITSEPPPISPAARPVHFGEALALIEAAGVFPETEMRRHRSFVNRAAKALQKVERNPDLTQLPCEPRLLSKVLEGFHPAQARIKKQQWQSIVSGLRRLQRMTGWIRPRERHRPRTDSWQSILSCVGVKGQRDGLQRFANFCTEVHVEPVDVTHGTFDDYVEWLEHNFMTLQARSSVTSVRNAWNRLCREHPEVGIRHSRIGHGTTWSPPVSGNFPPAFTEASKPI